MQFTLPTCAVRSWRTSDADPLARAANNRKIWINLRDAFPYPYTLKDAREYIRSVRQRTPETSFAIAVNDEAIGGVGFMLKPDVERVSAEIGYWLAEPFWGRGIASDALKAVTAHAVATHQLTRIFAVPFAWNAASCRVLEKAGYVLETRLRRSAIKDGQMTDQLQYAFIVPGDLSAAGPPPTGTRG